MSLRRQGVVLGGESIIIPLQGDIRSLDVVVNPAAGASALVEFAASDHFVGASKQVGVSQTAPLVTFTAPDRIILADFAAHGITQPGQVFEIVGSGSNDGFYRVLEFITLQEARVLPIDGGMITEVDAPDVGVFSGPSGGAGSVWVPWSEGLVTVESQADVPASSTALMVTATAGDVEFVINGGKARTQAIAAPSVPVDAREWEVGSYNQKSGPLTNVVNGRTGTLSFWFKNPLATSGQPLAIGNINTGMQIKNFGADQMQVVLYTVTTNALTINFVADWTTAGAGWNHIMLSWDHVLPADAVANVTGYLNGVLQVNGVDGATVTQGSVDDDLKYNDAIAQGNSLPVGFNFKGCLSEFYLNFEDRVDLSLASNRERFRSAGGDAIAIGGDGSGPTGSQPAFYAANGELNPNAGKSDDIPVAAGEIVDCVDAPTKVAPPPPFVPPTIGFGEARDWDGATRNRRSGSVPTGVTDTRTGVLSFWVNADTIEATEDLIMMCVDQIGGGAIGLQLRRTNFSGGKIVMNMPTTSGASAIIMNNGGTMIVDTWHHFLYAWEYIFPADSAANFKLYFDGVQQLDGVNGCNITQGSNDNDIAWATRGNAWTQGSAGANFDGGGFGGPRFFDGCLSNFYLNIDEHIDITIQANREKFRTGAAGQATGVMVDLGADGSSPTGSQPAFYAANGELNTNQGYAEDLPVITGAVTDCADAPPIPVVTLPVSGYDYTTDNYVLATPGAGFDSDTCTISLWFKYDSAVTPEGNNFMFHFSGGRMFVDIATSGVVFFEGWNSGPTKIQRFDSNAIPTLLTDDTWHHLLITRSGTSLGQIYIDDVDVLNSHTVNSAGNISLGSLGWYIGMAFNNTFGWKGCLSNIWIDTAAAQDLSVVSNRRKFITASLLPVDPGADGSGPTGLQPIVWIPNGLPTTNGGSQGNFSLTSGDGAVPC